MWVNDYTNIKFLHEGRNRDDGVDCWGICALVYKDMLGIDLPNVIGMPKDCDLATLRKVAKTVKEEAKNWVKVDVPKEFDLVVMAPTGGLSFHIGVMVDNRRMLHIQDGMESTVERVGGLMWKNRIEGFYRHASRN